MLFFIFHSTHFYLNEEIEEARRNVFLLISLILSIYLDTFQYFILYIYYYVN